MWLLDSESHGLLSVSHCSQGHFGRKRPEQVRVQTFDGRKKTGTERVREERERKKKKEEKKRKKRVNEALETQLT